MFKIHIQNACKDWTDYNLYRHALHDVTLTHHRASDTWDGMIRLAKTAQADFGEERQLPRSITQKLATLITKSGMMKTKAYNVQIEAIITKTIRVNAIDEDAACELAHEIFTVGNDGNEERYEENTLNICEAR